MQYLDEAKRHEYFEEQELRRSQRRSSTVREIYDLRKSLARKKEEELILKWLTGEIDNEEFDEESKKDALRSDHHRANEWMDTEDPTERNL